MEEMGHTTKACDECKQTGLLIHGKRVFSFFKPMIGEDFSKILYFPPRFTRSVPNLAGQETYLEDTSGQRWRITVSEHDGSLAILKGWSEFSSEHGVTEGDFLVFHYVPGQHFIVQIFGITACEKNMKTYGHICKGKKRSRSYPEETSQDNKKIITPSSKLTKGQSVQFAIAVDESLCMANRDAYDHGDARSYLNLSSFEMPDRKPLNHVETSLRSKLKAGADDSPPLDQKVGRSTSDHTVLLSDDKEGSCRGSNQITREKSQKASWFDEAKGTRLLKKKPEESTAKADCPARPISGVEKLSHENMTSLIRVQPTRVVKKKVEETSAPARDIHCLGERRANGYGKVIKSKPVYYGDGLFPLIGYSCLVEVNGQNYLVKSLKDFQRDVFRVLEFVEQACALTTLQMGEYVSEVSHGIDTYNIKEPVGVCDGVCPFNFPPVIPLWGVLTPTPLFESCAKTQRQAE